MEDFCQYTYHFEAREEEPKGSSNLFRFLLLLYNNKCLGLTPLIGDRRDTVQYLLCYKQTTFQNLNKF